MPVETFVIEATAGWDQKQVESVRLLGSDAKVRWEMAPEGLRIVPPKDMGSIKYAWSFEIITNEEQHHPAVIQTDADKVLEGIKIVDLDGKINSKKN